MKRSIFFLMFAIFNIAVSFVMFNVCINSLTWSKFFICSLPLILSLVCMIEITIINPINKK